MLNALDIHSLSLVKLVDWTGAIATLLCLVSLIATRTCRSLWAFTGYLVYVTVVTLIGIFALEGQGYWWDLLLSDPIDSLFQMAVIWELGSEVTVLLRGRTVPKVWLRGSVVLVSCTLIAILIASTARYNDMSRQLNYLTRFDLGFDIVRVLLFMLLFFAFLFYGLKTTRIHLKIAWSLAIYSSLSLAGEAAKQLVLLRRFSYRMFDYIELVSVVLWSIVMLVISSQVFRHSHHRDNAAQKANQIIALDWIITQKIGAER